MFVSSQIKLQDDVSAQMTEIQRLKGKASPWLGRQRAHRSSVHPSVDRTTFSAKNPLEKLSKLTSWVHVGVVANRASEGAEARVNEAGGAAQRSEEEQHYVGKKTGV